MPQLDFSTWPPQLIWLLISFAALYVIMAKAALPRIANVIEQRKGRIANDLDMAHELKEKSEISRAEYEEALKKARGQAHDIAHETRDRLSRLAERQRSMAEGSLNARIEEAEARIAKTKAKAMSKLNTIASDTAMAVVKELIGGKIAKATVKQAVISAVGETDVE